MGRIYRLLGVDVPFDVSNRYTTSWLFSPLVLASIRLVFALYILTTLIYLLAYRARDGTAGQSFSYFTNLTYWGLGFYFLVSSIHGFSMVMTPSKISFLQRFPRPLQALHAMYYATVTTFPPIVTIVFWAILYSGPFFPLLVNRWSNISEHALNSFFALFEILLTRCPPPRWLQLPLMIVILALYLGLAYVTKATQGFYVYSFLDPSRGSGRVAGYVFGILVAEIIVFSIVKGVIYVRIWISEGKGAHHRDTTYPARSAKMEEGEGVEMGKALR